MIANLLSEIRRLDDITSHAGAELSALEHFEASRGLNFPSEHKEVLAWSNGIEVYGGYFRLFGVDAHGGIDSVVWNQNEHWKFAWHDRCSSFWCFGETAWGDQYAYSMGSIRAQDGGQVYFLDAISMTPQVIAASFSEFFEREFIRSAREPYDQMIHCARKKFGRLDVKRHLVYIPSLLLGGAEEVVNVQTMDARAAMICNGDIAVQLDDAPSNATLESVTSYEDSQSRTRVRLEWR